MREMVAGEVADVLQISARQAGQLMRSGAISSRRLPSGDWLTTPDAVTRYQTHYSQGRGRRLNAATAWGMLWELSGLGCAWLPSTTRARVRERIETSSAEQIIQAVAQRARPRRYSGAAKKVRSITGLVLTGSSVATSLDLGLYGSTIDVMGYVRGSVDAAAADAGLIPDHGGEHVLFEWSLPVAYRERQMPKAVISADLAQSSWPHVRDLSIKTMEKLRREWLARR